MTTHINEQNSSYSVSLGVSTSMMYPQTYQSSLMDGLLEVKLPKIRTDEKQRWSRRIEKRRAEERRSEKRKVRRKKIQAHEKIEKSRNTVFFQCVNVLWLWRFEK